jgi:hypothetical protein
MKCADELALVCDRATRPSGPRMRMRGILRGVLKGFFRLERKLYEESVTYTKNQ